MPKTPIRHWEANAWDEKERCPRWRARGKRKERDARKMPERENDRQRREVRCSKRNETILCRHAKPYYVCLHIWDAPQRMNICLFRSCLLLSEKTLMVELFVFVARADVIKNYLREIRCLVICLGEFYKEHICACGSYEEEKRMAKIFIIIWVKHIHDSYARKVILKNEHTTTAISCREKTQR